MTDKENIDPKQRNQHSNATNDYSVADILRQFEASTGHENLPPRIENSAVSNLAPKCTETADLDTEERSSDSDMSDDSDLNLDNTTGNYCILANKIISRADLGFESWVESEVAIFFIFFSIFSPIPRPVGPILKLYRALFDLN